MKRREIMGYNHRDLVVIFSKLVATVINWIFIFIGIAAIGFLIYGFYIFIVNPYEPGSDPMKKDWLKKSKSSTSYYVPYVDSLQTTYNQYIV
jgi:hypothetical protein